MNMSKRDYFSWLWFIALVLSIDQIGCSQPYFPPQITFSINDDQTIMAIDEINQQAYQTSVFTGKQYSFAMKHFQYAIPDSPESKNYVQLRVDQSISTCFYETYWKYGGNFFTSFPQHWSYNSTSFYISNYLKFDYEMIHSSNDTETEDYWYANELCRICGHEEYPCDAIYFKKNTNIPIRRVQAFYGQCTLQTTTYTVISIGKPDENLFNAIPKIWAYICQDVSLRIQYNPQLLIVVSKQTSKTQVWLASPPHLIHGNDTVIIQWQISTVSNCSNCITWTPERLVFNSTNFDRAQDLVITRIKIGEVILLPICQGGGYELAIPASYPIYIE